MNPAPGQHQRGFTLIEILVVMVIVSIMTGLAVTSMPALVQSGEFDTESRRLITLLRMAREEAVLQGEEYGLRVADDGYEFMVYDEAAQGWVSMARRPFNARLLPEGMELLLEVEDNVPMLGNEEDEDATIPRIMLFSSGETTPFDLILAMPDEERVRQLGTDGYRRIEWQDEDEAR